MNTQQHPLYADDRLLIDQLLANASNPPQDEHIIHTARLMNRYWGFPGAHDIRGDLIKVAQQMCFENRAELNQAARRIWQTSFRPQPQEVEIAVGSGADVTGES